jgi:predicted DNA-binding protein with PD1-like motif
MHKQLVGKLDTVIATSLEPGEDLLAAITEVARQNDIKAGVVMSITGALDKARVQHFKGGEIEVVDVSGPVEASGHGIIGKVRAPQYGDQPVGVHPLYDQGPYIHVHMTMTNEKETICGHLMPGCTVWSKQPRSHFTVFLASFSGMRLFQAAGGDPARPEEGFRLYHDLVAEA